MAKSRPVYLNLLEIRQPLPAIVSILHRISGALLFLVGIPFLLSVVGASRASEASFAQLRAGFASPVAKLLLLLIAWAYLHHFCAGIRYLLFDVRIGGELAAARRSGGDRAGREPRAHPRHRSAAMVNHRPLRTPVGAHYGTFDWLAQRVTAVVMAVYTIVLLAIVLWNGGLDYASVERLLASGPFRLLSFVFMVALLYHAWVGVRDIYMDYIKPVGVRILVQVLSIVLLVAYLGWTIQLLWGTR